MARAYVMVDPRRRPMKRARAAKVSLVLASLSGAGSGDLGRRGGPVHVLEMVCIIVLSWRGSYLVMLIVVAVMVRVRLDYWWRSGPLVRRLSWVDG